MTKEQYNLCIFSGSVLHNSKKYHSHRLQCDHNGNGAPYSFSLYNLHNHSWCYRKSLFQRVHTVLRWDILIFQFGILQGQWLQIISNVTQKCPPMSLFFLSHFPFETKWHVSIWGKVLNIKWHHCMCSDRSHSPDNSIFIHSHKFVEECLVPPLLRQSSHVYCSMCPTHYICSSLRYQGANTIATPLKRLPCQKMTL